MHVYMEPPRSIDAIVSIDAFEHFSNPASALKTMHAMLNPGGRVYVSFGPTWYHPLGGHLFSVFPWAHLLFSETALCVRGDRMFAQTERVDFQM